MRTQLLKLLIRCNAQIVILSATLNLSAHWTLFFVGDVATYAQWTVYGNAYKQQRTAVYQQTMQWQATRCKAMMKH